MKKILPFLLILFTSWCYSQSVTLDYYLPDDVSYNSEISKPEDVIGHEVGEWHVSHDKLVNYMYKLAEESDRIAIHKTGETYEGRPLLLLTITSPNNHQNMDEIRIEHLKLCDPAEDQNVDNMPAVVYMGYSIHGNEPSGSNAALVAAYHLAAAQGTEINDLLNNVVILLDPSFNPDGLDRFASWVNTNKSQTNVTDTNNRELQEPWPGGRTNHYWFDMNRDWLPVQLPESQARLATFHNWKPNILTDHHEMGSNSTFFFQPGIPSRNNPLTPVRNYELTEAIATYHAEALDQIGSLYYSKESFDDFYYGKGSTYPDVNGGIGILFEQASSRGHARNTSNGVLEFPFTIRNQFITTLSTLKAAKELRLDLLNHQKEFYQSALKLAASDNIKAYAFNDTDGVKLDEFVKILDRHKITVYNLTKSINGISKDGLIVPLNQPQYRLIKAIFEKRTTFTDSLFYDVSSWTLPLAFNINYSEVSGKTFNNSLLGDQYNSVKRLGMVIGEKSSYAYVLDWKNYNAPRLLNQLQSKGIYTKVAMKEFKTDNLTFDAGSIIIPVQNQKIDDARLYQFLNLLAQDTGATIYALKSGKTEGINLGSPQITSLPKLKVALLVGDGISSYEAGEVWHLLDTRMQMPLSRIDIETFNKIDADEYTTLILVSGSYSELNEGKLKTWIQQGGNIVAIKSAARWLSSKGISNVTFKKNGIDSIDSRMPYELDNLVRGAQVIGGAIFEGTVDLTHPISYGLERSSIPVFRNSTLFMEYSKSRYASPVVYADSPLMSGYISEENLNKLKGTAIVNVSSFGSGKIISFADNPNFRAFWYGTNKLFLNSLFFGDLISSSSLR